MLCLLSSYYLISVFRLSIFHNLIFSMAVVGVATRGHVHGRDEVVLDELSKSGDLLIFLLHDLDVLGKLQHKFVGVMVSTIEDVSTSMKYKLHSGSSINLTMQCNGND